jgi:cytochrome oxidase assembly protein ShyY1
MNGWRFALSRRWFGYLALAVAFAVGCAGLAAWQFARRDEARTEIERVEANWDSTPRGLVAALPTLTSFDPAYKWMPVAVTGRYLTDDQLLVRGRPRDGRAGFAVLVPLQLADGSVFVVDRGWLPVGNAQDVPDVIPAAPAGTVSVVVRLKAGEPTLLGRSAPAGQIATVNLPDVASRVGKPTYTGAYGLLASEDPAPPVRPSAVAKPVADEGPHLSYAFQWVAFALMGFIGLGWAVRQEFRIRNAEDPEERARAARRKRKADAKPRTDSQIEDELLEGSSRNASG